MAAQIDTAAKALQYISVPPSSSSSSVVPVLVPIPAQQPTQPQNQPPPQQQQQQQQQQQPPPPQSDEAFVRLRGCRDEAAIRDALALFATDDDDDDDARGVHLDCKGCRCLTEELLVEFLPKLRRRLVSLDLTSQLRLSDRTLLALSSEGNHSGNDGGRNRGSDDGGNDGSGSSAEGRLSLRELLLAGCPLLSDAGVASAARAAGGKLRSLSLTGLTHCTDAALAAVADQCPNLESLFLGGNGLVTDGGVLDVARRCPKLQRLKIGGCRLVTQRAISALQSDCPDLAVVYFLGDSAPKAMPRAAPPPPAATRVR